MYALLQGALTQARILDDLSIIREARLGLFDLLGIAATPRHRQPLDPSSLAAGVESLSNSTANPAGSYSATAK